MVLGLAACAEHTEPLGTMDHRRGQIRLFDEACAGGSGQRAVQREAVHERRGCWQSTPAGNVLVTWEDGARQVLDGNRVKLAPRVAALLEEPGLEAPEDFARPVWCAQAKLPHERAVCSDPDLAARDLALSDLWRAWRSTQKDGRAAETRVRRDYFQRLKACGADKDCIAREQQVQMQRYRRAAEAR